MRESVLQLVTENLDETLAKKVLNALTPWLGEKSKALEAALKVRVSLKSLYAYYIQYIMYCRWQAMRLLLDEKL
jgi:hypothetical protein